MQTSVIERSRETGNSNAQFKRTAYGQNAKGPYENRAQQSVNVTEQSPSGKNQPEKRISTGAISATIWQHVSKLKNGQESEYKTVTLQRRYKDKNDKWQTASSLRVNDLPKAALVLSKAYEYIVLKDKPSEHGEPDPADSFEDIEEEMVV